MLSSIADSRQVSPRQLDWSRSKTETEQVLKDRMRILYIVDTVSPFYTGGYETRYYQIAKRLAREGHGDTLLNLGTIEEGSLRWGYLS